MSVVPIPDWNPKGVIPPFNSVNPTAAARSPYRVSLADFIRHFTTSDQRLQVLTGFLNYRETLQKIGLVVGFQWVNGSFLENIEITESRSPGDIDVVTFTHLPEGATQREILEKNPRLFHPSTTKTDY